MKWEKEKNNNTELKHYFIKSEAIAIITKYHHFVFCMQKWFNDHQFIDLQRYSWHEAIHNESTRNRPSTLAVLQQQRQPQPNVHREARIKTENKIKMKKEREKESNQLSSANTNRIWVMGIEWKWNLLCIKLNSKQWTLPIVREHCQGIQW